MDFGDMVNKAKDTASNLSDEQIAATADQIMDKTPDSLDSKVQALADQAKKMND